jgi:hypothetical protein
VEWAGIRKFTKGEKGNGNSVGRDFREVVAALLAPGDLGSFNSAMAVRKAARERSQAVPEMR